MGVRYIIVMYKRKSFSLLMMTIVLLSTPIAFVAAPGGTGSLRINPHWEIITASPAEFNISTQTGVAYDPHIFLVIPQSCWNGLSLTEDTTVTWIGGSSPPIAKGDWIGPEDSNGDKLPPGASNGAGYTVGSLKSHLGLSEPVYYIFEPIFDLPDDKLTTNGANVTITLHSSAPRMLVYALGKQEQASSLYDVSVPPTQPGFVVPEVPLGTLMGLASMMAALILLAKRPTLAFRK